MGRLYKDRRDAGRILATKLDRYAARMGLLILALPRGGVPVAFEAARALRAPLDVFLVRKLGVPGYEEQAFGAIASGGVRVLDSEVVRRANVSEAAVITATHRELDELKRREEVYRHGRPMPPVAGRTVILIDDGLATGASMRAAVQALRMLGPAEIVVAVPVAPEAACRELAYVADDVVCAATPRSFRNVGEWYDDFSQVSDDEVVRLLEEAGGRG
jgi:predicted phosphoribosyltransferase